MNTFIALLRGVNVGGKKIKMADLQGQLQDLGLENVRTYIQSGNIVFNTEEDAETAGSRISAMIGEAYGFEVPVIVRTVADLRAVVAGSPFAKDPAKDNKRFYITFLAEAPSPERLADLAAYSFPEEEYFVEGKTIYFYSPNSYGRAKMNNNFFEQKLKVAGTTRNWRRTLKLIEMAEE